MKRRIKFIVIIFVIISSISFIDTTKSRYLSELNMSDNISVAIPQIVIDMENNQNATIIPGNTKFYEFCVKNYENTKINEVLMNYYIVPNITKSDIPLTYKVYEITGSAQVELTQTSEGFGPITLNYGTEEEKKYKITFTWAESNNDVSYANKEFKFKIGINATQVIY